LHNEDDGFSSGFMGYTKPITKAVYGNFRLVEALATKGGSPLDLHLDLKWEMNAEHLEAYARAALIFCEAYFTSDHPTHHSYAFYQMLDHFKSSAANVHRVKGADNDYWKTDEYRRLKITIRFIRDLVALMDKHNVPHWSSLKPLNRPFDGAHNQIADLISDVIFAAACVSEPSWTCWSIQHNAVWTELFHNRERTRTGSIIRFKVRRLLYDEIKRMEQWGNFKGARILGMCLNVLGFSETRTRRDYDREEVSLRIAVVGWTKETF
jgi:hypothetical protein